MNVELHDNNIREVSLDEAEAELNRLLSDVRFRASDRQREILRYLAVRRFNGCRENVKAYSIALDVLGRSSDFDASIDPIVRIEISRLRTALDSYYSVFGPELGVAIHIPKGSYVSYFLTAPVTSVDDVVADVEEHEHVLSAPDITAAKSNRRWRSAAIVTIASTSAIAIWWIATHSPVQTIKPTLTVSMVAVSPMYAGDASVTRDTVMTALSQFDTVMVTKIGYTPSHYKQRYELNLKYYADTDDRSILWQVVDTTDGHLLKAGLEKVDLEGKAPATARLELAGAIARRVVSARGVINSTLAREAPDNAIGNACVARAEIMLDAADTNDKDAVELCLKRTLLLDPNNPDASAALARLYAQQPETAGESLDLAKAAVSNAPLSDRAHLALMAARFANGRIDAAIDAGNKAVALNPYNSGTAAYLSLVLFSGGYWKAASDMARSSAALEDTPPCNASLVLALEAYRNHDWSEASLVAEQALGNDLLTRSIRAAALGNLGAESATRRLQDVRERQNGFEIAFRQAAKSAGVPSDIIQSLEGGLTKAGADFDTVASISRQ